MKSQVNDQIELAECILIDAFAKCAADLSALRDIMTMKSRVEHEGLSFLTLTLPSLGKDFEKALDQGYIDSTLFKSFKKNGAIPAFLQGMLSLVFFRGTGRRLEHVDVQAIEGIREIAYAFKKLEIDCTLQRVQSALDGFKAVERVLDETYIKSPHFLEFVEVADCLWDCLRNINVEEAVPRHGPGATAEGIIGNDKYTWQFWYERLEPYFPFFANAYTLGSYGSKEFENVTFVSSEAELPVKVTPVPKTQKGPRIIAIEPTCMQYAQQAIRKQLYAVIESSKLSAGHVNFTNQMVNRELAMKSSIDGSMATLDLSDASDRVYGELALNMFNCNPDLRDAIDACRSTHAKLPDGTIVGPLKKFASMGSALCFPVEAMYFYTICVLALLREQNLLVTTRNILKVSRGVYVYGDDIIVPREQAATVVDYLHRYMCKVNISKSHWNGKFRESCGMDAYEGIDVTPVYVHTLHPDSRRKAHELISWVSTANAFQKKGYADTSSYMFQVCERYLGDLPVVSETSSVLGRVLDAPLTTGRWNKDLHRPEIRGWSASPVRRTDKLQGHGALVKCLLSLSNLDDLFQLETEVDHLERTGRRDAVTLKRRWCPIN